MSAAQDAIQDATSEVACDMLVIGGGTAGPMAALKAKLRNPAARVMPYVKCLTT